MEIIHIAAECYPMAKVGGLGDVVGALPKYQKREGNQLKVIIPRYDTQYTKQNELYCVFSGIVVLGNFNFPFQVFKSSAIEFGYELYLVAIDELFDRTDIYGYQDDIERFLAFQIASLNWICSCDSVPDLIHCHDHHTGLIPFMMQFAYQYQKLSNVKTTITVHNAIYQGQFGFDKLYYLPDFDLSRINVLEWDNKINSLATALKCATVITTVSPNFLNEINQSGYGLETLFNSVRHKSFGILNGIDTQVWNPSKDAMIEFNYSIVTMSKGKDNNKVALCNQFGLNPSKPLFSFIGRLLDEKGADLLPQAVAVALSEHYKEINILILGSGNPSIETQLKHLQNSFTGNYNVFIGYNEALAHQMYAGSDFLLMPSRVEPCGLNQMYAFKYGTIPIVRRTGGLKDTVQDIGDNGTGICHNQASVEDICYSIKRAIQLFKDKKKFTEIRKKGMKLDHSWEKVCLKYIEMYHLNSN